MAENTIQIGSGRQKRKARWPFIVALAVTIVFAIGAGVFVRWAVDRNKGPIKAPEQLAPEILEVQDLALNGKQDEADKKIGEILTDPAVSADVKFTLYLQQGSNYYSKGEYQKALESYTKASEIRDTFEIAQAMASIWQQLGDKQQAIKYLRHAIEVMPPDNPVREDDIQLIEEQIRTLESGA